jgi:arsenate reductase
MASSMAQVEPLPLVPATVITGQPSAGPCAGHGAHAVQAQSMFFGCRRSQCASHSSRHRQEGPRLAHGARHRSTRSTTSRNRACPPSRLAAWLHSNGWETLLNRKGKTWRKLDATAQASVADAASARALMLAQPSVIKRPVVDWGRQTTVGFDPDAWQALR